MKYTHITLDMGAPEKYYKALWINLHQFKDVIIYLEDFHVFMHFFIAVENFLVTVALKSLYIRQECVQWVE